ncbi:MAG: arsenite efflux transporter metallochaperone ArsD, partial [Opitutales bacterium]
TGVCGPEVDPVLVRFAADLKWLQERGVTVARYNLSQNPAAFVENATVKAALSARGEPALPLVLVDGKTLVSGSYPTRAELAAAVGVEAGAQGIFTPAVAELVAIGAAIAANCDPCLRFHVNAATKQGATLDDITLAIEMGVKVKDAPHRAILRLAARLTHPEPAPAAAESTPTCCAGKATSTPAGGNRCCG